jgi:DNA-binding response OmpR family regulator
MNHATGFSVAKEETEMSKRILIVEDSATQAVRARLLLEEVGYVAETAEHGEIGLERALANPPDLVVADIVMPVMDGYEMTRRLKTDARTAAVPVLMLTSRDKPLDVIRGLEVGADHFVTKPYDNEYLIQRVEALFDQQTEAQAGHLPEQRALDYFSQEIVITKSREQILQVLLQATARVLDCEAMGLFRPSGDQRLFFLLSFRNLADPAVEQLGSMMANAMTGLRPELPASAPMQTVRVVAESGADQPGFAGDLGASFMQAPLVVEGQIAGLVGVFSTEPHAFDIEHVRFLFEIGQKAAEALSRVRLGADTEGT